MRKWTVIVMCIVILALGLTGCGKTQPQVVTPTATYATVTFVVSEDLYAFTAPDPMEVEVGSVVTLPLPEGAVPIDAHDELCWFDDATYTTPHDSTQPIVGDATLYLYEVGKTYTISYTGLEGFDVAGEYVYSYRYDGEGTPGALLPQADKPGYYTGLYCVELDGYYQRVPTSAGCDLTFTAPKAIGYPIHYASGLEGVAMDEIDNPNPAEYNQPEGILVLQPASMEGKVFDCWVLKVWTTPRTFELEGETIQLTTSGTVVTRLSYEMITWGAQNFTLEAKWK